MNSYSLKTFVSIMNPVALIEYTQFPGTSQIPAFHTIKYDQLGTK